MYKSYHARYTEIQILAEFMNSFIQLLDIKYWKEITGSIHQNISQLRKKDKQIFTIL